MIIFTMIYKKLQLDLNMADTQKEVTLAVVNLFASALHRDMLWHNAYPFCSCNTYKALLTSHKGGVTFPSIWQPITLITFFIQPVSVMSVMYSALIIYIYITL